MGQGAVQPVQAYRRARPSANTPRLFCSAKKDPPTTSKLGWSIYPQSKQRDSRPLHATSFHEFHYNFGKQMLRVVAELFCSVLRKILILHTTRLGWSIYPKSKQQILNHYTLQVLNNSIMIFWTNTKPACLALTEFWNITTGIYRFWGS